MNDIENETVKMSGGEEKDEKVDINEELDYEEDEINQNKNIKVNSEDGELKSDSDDNGELVSFFKILF